VMALCSYVFVNRSLDHRHQVEGNSLEHHTLAGEVLGYQGRTTLDSSHRHEVDLDTDNAGQAAGNHGHFHAIEARGEGHEVSGAKGIMRARVPQWGKLKFRDRQGVEKERGINVGSEWTYRSFIEGSSQAAATWTFENLDESFDPNGEGLDIGLIVRVFRTHKGIVGQAIGGAFQVRNPETGVQSDLVFFEALDAKIMDITIDRKLTSTDNAELDLFEDLVSDNGRLEIVVQCMQKGQYFGFAQPDCYLRLPDASPVWNYVKVYLSIWVQMVIVTSIGVASSALLSGPVAMMFTVSFILLGFFRDFFVEVATGTSYGACGVVGPSGHADECHEPHAAERGYFADQNRRPWIARFDVERGPSAARFLCVQHREFCRLGFQRTDRPSAARPDYLPSLCRGTCRDWLLLASNTRGCQMSEHRSFYRGSAVPDFPIGCPLDS